jgi:hypothetical protein
VSVRLARGCGSDGIVDVEPELGPVHSELGVQRPIAERIVVSGTFEEVLDRHFKRMARSFGGPKTLARAYLDGTLQDGSIDAVMVLGLLRSPAFRGAVEQEVRERLSAALLAGDASDPRMSAEPQALVYASPDARYQLAISDADAAWEGFGSVPALRQRLSASLQDGSAEVALVEPTASWQAQPDLPAPNATAQRDPLFDVAGLLAFVDVDGTRTWLGPGVVLEGERVDDFRRLMGLLGGGDSRLEPKLVAALGVAWLDDGARVLNRAATGAPGEVGPPMGEHVNGERQVLYTFWTQREQEGARLWTLTLSGDEQMDLQVVRYERK